MTQNVEFLCANCNDDLCNDDWNFNNCKKYLEYLKNLKIYKPKSKTYISFHSVINKVIIKYYKKFVDILYMEINDNYLFKKYKYEYNRYDIFLHSESN